MDWGAILQAILFALFALLTAILAAITGPTYDNLLVPELSTASLFPALPPTGRSGGSFLSQAAQFSTYLLGNLVDPAIALVAVGLGFLYLLRSFSSRVPRPGESFLVRFVLSVVVANFTVPIAGAILSLAGAAYPVIAGFDGGRWTHWINLEGYAGLSFSWDNGALAFVLSFALFTVVLLLVISVALRDALLALLLVILPIFTLLWSIPTLSGLARRAWLLFGELAFLPCVLVIPLELAVGAPNVVVLLAYLVLALASPFLLSLTGAHLGQAGFPSPGAVISGGIQRGLAVASLSASNFVSHPSTATGRSRGSSPLVGSKSFSAGFPATAPLLAAEGIGRGTAGLLRHIRRFHSRPTPSEFRGAPRDGEAGG